MQECRGTLPLHHEVQMGPSYFQNSFSERSLGAARSNLSPRPGQEFMSNGINIKIKENILLNFYTNLLGNE